MMADMMSGKLSVCDVHSTSSSEQLVDKQKVEKFNFFLCAESAVFMLVCLFVVYLPAAKSTIYTIKNAVSLRK